MDDYKFTAQAYEFLQKVCKRKWKKKNKKKGKRIIVLLCKDQVSVLLGSIKMFTFSHLILSCYAVVGNPPSIFEKSIVCGW